MATGEKSVELSPVKISAPEDSSKIPRSGIERYIQQFGLDFDRDLQPEDLLIFSIARRVEPFIQGLKIPIAKKPNPEEKKVLIERRVDRVIEHTSYRDDQVVSQTPANSMDIGFIDGLEDLPDIVPNQWLIEEVAPEVFYQRAINRELLKREWRETVRHAETTYETVTDRELVEVPAPPEDEKQHAYVLLDVSSSMRSSGDYIIGKALALAFLRQGYEQRANLAIRPFDGRIGKLSSGRELSALRGITLSILRWNKYATDTNIQGALEQAVKDIRRGGEFTQADILLITDGAAPLTKNPLGEIRLHTLYLGSGHLSYTTEGGGTLTEEEHQKAEERSFGKDGDIPRLKQWSTTFRQFSVLGLASALRFIPEDFEDLQSVVNALPQALEEMSTSEDLERIRGRVNFLSSLYDQFRPKNALLALTVRVLFNKETLDKMQGVDLQKVLDNNQKLQAERARVEEAQRQTVLEEQAEIERFRAEELVADELERKRLLDLVDQYHPEYQQTRSTEIELNNKPIFKYQNPDYTEMMKRIWEYIKSKAKDFSNTII